VGHTALTRGIATVLFDMMFKLLPRASVAWKDVWMGAGAAAALFELGQMLIRPKQPEGLIRCGRLAGAAAGVGV